MRKAASRTLIVPKLKGIISKGKQSLLPKPIRPKGLTRKNSLLLPPPRAGSRIPIVLSRKGIINKGRDPDLNKEHISLSHPFS